MRRAAWAIGALLAFVPALLAGEHNTKLSTGSLAPRWSNLPGVDGQNHSFDDFKDKEILVVVFTCCSCPIASDYDDRLVAFANKYVGPQGKLGLVAINVNAFAEDRLPNMQARAKEKRYTFPYLYDETQQSARDYGAEQTPQFFVLDRDRKVVYMGQMDDNTEPAKAKVNFVEEAVKATLKGAKPKVEETFANGCRIRWQKKRRSKP